VSFCQFESDVFRHEIHAGALGTKAIGLLADAKEKEGSARGLSSIRRGNRTTCPGRSNEERERKCGICSF
jgi:hypothetical protein